jgi:hypothetical protein
MFSHRKTARFKVRLILSNNLLLTVDAETCRFLRCLFFWFAHRDIVPEKLEISALSPIALPTNYSGRVRPIR